MLELHSAAYIEVGQPYQVDEPLSKESDIRKLRHDGFVYQVPCEFAGVHFARTGVRRRAFSTLRIELIESSA